MTDELLALAYRWRDADPDPATRDELDELLTREDTAGLAELFDGELEFGTAGLRGPMGPGPRRMNRVVVRRTAAALAAHLRAAGSEEASDEDRRPLVVVGHDARHRSARFALDVIEVMSAEGVDVEHFDEPVPTPLLATAVVDRAATAGVMVTASHNPAGDNGMKVYAADGAQIVTPSDRQIAARLRDLPLVVPSLPSSQGSSPSTGTAPSDGTAPGSIRSLGGPSSGGDVVEHYLARAAALVGEPLPRALRVAHTSLHGVGDVLLNLALDGLHGITVAAVESQRAPDPDFPTVRTPNPEEPGTLDRLVALAARLDADVALALDPDADRLAVALPHDTPGGDPSHWRVLTGDEVGALLTEHLLTTTSGADRLVASTVVSSRLVTAMCAEAGVHHVETLTGFKWLCRPGLDHPEWHQLLLYEEALGYAVGRDARDKDGITAALTVLAAVSRWSVQGRTAWDVLDDLAIRHGVHVTRNGSLRDDTGGDLARRVAELARRPPTALGGVDAVGVDRPAPDVVRWVLADRTRVVVRPSGTEPKAKFYVEAIEPVRSMRNPSAVDPHPLPPATNIAAQVTAARVTAAERADRVVTDLIRRLTG